MCLAKQLLKASNLNHKQYFFFFAKGCLFLIEAKLWKMKDYLGDMYLKSLAKLLHDDWKPNLYQHIDILLFHFY